MSESTFPGGGNPFGSRQGSMQHVNEDDEASDTITSPTNTGSAAAPGSSTFPSGSNFSFSASSGSNPPSAFRPPGPDDQGFPNNYNMTRRTSVSAESLTPSSHQDSNWKPPFHQKTPDQLQRLRESVSSNFLFSHLDDDNSSVVLGALMEKPIPAAQIKVITQGDAGDYFYVVERGVFDIYVNSAGHVTPGQDGMGQKVNTIGPGGSFGELALMYNAPRAATVVSTEKDSTLWALDRVTFRRILMDSAFQRRRMYESFLEEVPLLSTLTLYERSKIADALDTKKFPPGATIIQEGDPGEAFFILESGEAEVFKRESGDSVLKKYGKGDYFGELALLDDKPRAASVVAGQGGEVKVAYLGKQGFQRLLGPVEGIMRRNDYSGGGQQES
ncbi:cAMP-dependent protein kinase regulator, partial [Lecanoromycetidae sp. Uapishka_2]